VKVGAVRTRTVRVRQHRPFGEQESAIGLVHDAGGRVEAGIRGVASPELAGIEDVMRQVVQLRRVDGAAERLSVLRATLDGAGRHEQPLPRLGFEVVPQLVGPPQQRHI
jgi:hypothetical protein